jgi:rfaE bifunctional protein kinase chain/domain
VLVVGDLMLDRFVYGTVSRISPEAPVPVVKVTKETSMPGGASNVACNIRALGGKAAVAGMIGKDAAGVELALAADACAGGGGVRHDVCGGQHDREGAHHRRAPAGGAGGFRARGGLVAAQSEKFLAMLAVELGRADGVIIEDYGKGAVTQAVVDLVLAIGGAAGDSGRAGSQGRATT